MQIDVPAELLPKVAENSSVYWKALAAAPGRYRFDIVVKDVNGDRVGTWSHGMSVPDFLKTSWQLVADCCRPDGAGAGEECGHRKFRDRHHQGAPARGAV